MISQFIQKKLDKATYKILEDKTYYGEISGLKGVWANAKTLEECRKDLEEVLEDWIIVKIKSDERIPGLPFDFDKRKNFSYAS